LVLAGCASAAGPRKLKPGFNLFSPEQDIQMGKEYAAQVEKEMPVVRDPDLNNFFNNIGQKLAQTQPAKESGFPFSFKVIHDSSINAFALPGGPTFMHTGLITAADNESQIAGVVAHELGHVILRHGTNQASKANLIQLPAMIGGAIAGNGISGQLAQLGIGLGANSVILKFSRNAERDADLLGTRIMHEAGYNPIEMARFFEKLEAEAGKSGRLSSFFSDHPNPGDRVKAVQDEIKLLPARGNYNAESGQLARMKQIVSRLGDPPKQPASKSSNAAGNSDPAASRPSRSLKTLQTNGMSLSYPQNWEAFADQQGSETTIAPRTALFQDQQGATSIGYGMIVGGQPSDKNSIRDKTRELLQTLLKGNPSMSVVGNPKTHNVNGRAGLLQQLSSSSPYPNAKEADVLLTVDRQGGLFYIIFISPESEYGNYAWPVYEQVIGSIRFNQ
jgi:hypothetical protein